MDVESNNGKFLVTIDGRQTEFIFFKSGESDYSIADVGENRAVMGQDYHVEIALIEDCGEKTLSSYKSSNSPLKPKKQWFKRG